MVMLKRDYTVHKFIKIFKFCQGVIDISSSPGNVQKWSRVLYCNLGAQVKLYIDWKDNKNSKANSPNNRIGLLKFFDDMSTSQVMKGIRPGIHEIALVPQDKKSPNKKKQPGNTAAPVNMVDTTLQNNLTDF
ncbi:hypothetical protein MCOR02_009930 [Pyricularia oryzae]|nr:hypothetical protein MCOR02_009930 [Pyricularia oryzae]